jgi:type III secretion protein L
MNENALLLKSPNKKIIKNGSLPVNSVFFGRLLKNQVLKAEEQARKITLAANQQSDNLVAVAVAEAVEIRRSAYATGREEAVLELLENVLAAKEKRASALHEIEQDVLKLSLKVAEKIIGREIEKDETIRGEIILTALRQARQQEMMTVRVNAADLPLVEKMREKIDAFGRARYLDFVADQAVKEGGCLIESASGTIDARLETQLRVFEKALLAQTANQSE